MNSIFLRINRVLKISLPTHHHLFLPLHQFHCRALFCINALHTFTIKASSDPLHIHRDPITRTRAKKIQDVLNGLIEKIWTENAIQDARDDELGLERSKVLWALFKLLGSQINTQFG